MAHTFDSFPITREKVDEIPFPHLVEIVTEIANPETNFVGTSALQVNAFLALAAVRMARAIYKTPTGSVVHTLKELDRCVRENIEIG